MPKKNHEPSNSGFLELNDSTHKSLRKKFIYYGLAWLTGLFVFMDLFDALYFVATTPGPFPSRIEPPAFLFAIVFWSIYWYADLAWRLWLRLRKTPIDLEVYKWGLIGTWVLISISMIGFYSIRYDRSVGEGIVGLLLLGFLPGVIYSCIGGVVGIQVFERTRNLSKINNLHRIGMIVLIFSVTALSLSQLQPESGAEPAWWQIAIMALGTASFVTLIIAVVARTVKARAEFQCDDEDEAQTPTK